MISVVMKSDDLSGGDRAASLMKVSRSFQPSLELNLFEFKCVTLSYIDMQIR